MSALADLLDHYRQTAQTEREKGTYFEELIRTYFRHEPVYADLYAEVWLYADWAKAQNLVAKDTGIDLVARTRGTDEFHAIQCKFYDAGHRIRKDDIDSFFTASGQKPFTHRVIVSTTNDWTDNAEQSLIGQQPPVTKIDLHDLETSLIDWARYRPAQPPALKPRKTLRPHQASAVASVLAGLAKADRGKLIMACGTGKTFTSLKLAEKLAGPGGRVLFLVPSLSLLSQSLTEWTQESALPLHSFAVCSDAEVGKKRKRDEDVVETFAHELRYPATTDARHLAVEVGKRHDAAHLSVVFSTYHSIEVVSRAQHLHGLPAFDLIICDEAHRTTGATFENDDESNFVKVHDAAFLRAAKRLYMTATPRIYADLAKAVAEKDSIALCSMDDPALYGEQLHLITFSEAVSLGLLCDYKVIVLTIDEAHVSSRLQTLLADENNTLKVDDAARIIGCWKALGKQGLLDADPSAPGALPDPMRRAVAFCQVIEPALGAKTHKVSSKQIADMFAQVVAAYQAKEEPTPGRPSLRCEARHVDGTMNASAKEERLTWLKADPQSGTGVPPVFSGGTGVSPMSVTSAPGTPGSRPASDSAPKDSRLPSGSQPSAPVCRILSNVRCLSEGVDVPALDAVLFLTPRSSPVDVVQSVGRVMRNSPGKKRGYIILPVVIPAGLDPAEALNDNKVYKVVWEVLQALRSHDDRFDAFINKLDLIGKDPRKMEVVAITDQVPRKSAALSVKGAGKKSASAAGQHTIGVEEEQQPYGQQAQLQFHVGELEKALYARVVKKCGNRNYWDEWAADIAKIAQTHITRITTIVQSGSGGPPLNSENPSGKLPLPLSREAAAFSAFAKELRDDLNDSITDAEVIEMLAQHLITKPVFDALFKDYSFASHNPVSLAMQQVLDVLHEHRLEKEADTLEKFYASVRQRADGIESATGKQKIVVELYDKFFRNAFPRMTERLGIVYTPVEVVDFIIHSINDLLKQEFDVTLGSKGVHIIDPFTGTGTFITRLLQSGLIPLDQLPHKYKHEIHANEIVLLAYYIAAINIEAVYHSLMSAPKSGSGGPPLNSAAPTGHPNPAQGNALGSSAKTIPSPEGAAYEPFPGICLTDTFQLYEKGDLISNLLANNSDRRKRQKALDIRVIMGNPPYSAGQESANDNNQNVAYPDLDSRIRDTYAQKSNNANVRNLYDSYIRAIRWGSDRLGESGIMAYVSGSAWIERSFADGLRQCLVEEFTDLYVVHLRGDIRKNMLSKGAAKEGENVFGSGSMTGIAISLLVKNPNAKGGGRIHFHNIGDALKSEEKLAILIQNKSIRGITENSGWKAIIPDRHNDWLQQRNDGFSQFIVIGDKKNKEGGSLFSSYSLGLTTNRDMWCCGFSAITLETRIKEMICFYNSEVARFQVNGAGVAVESFISSDPTKISWSRGLKRDLENGKLKKFEKASITKMIYRPFTKEWVYFHRTLNEYVNQMPKVFPKQGLYNIIICLSGVGARAGFSALASDCISNLETIEKCQCFPLYLYEKVDEGTSAEANSLFNTSGNDDNSVTGDYTRRDGINDAGLAHFQAAYPGEKLTKEDVFYYVYGLLHSPDYRTRYADNLGKELPRIPCVKTAADFWAFSQAGRDLAELHLHYETIEPHPVTLDLGKNRLSALTDADYRVTKMKFAVKGDKTTVVYNPHITIRNIPIEAYDYVVNGKPALEWVMERQAVTTDKDSGIVNDANLWATETMGNARYPLDLFCRVITVSLRTMKIVQALPALDI